MPSIVESKKEEKPDPKYTIDGADSPEKMTHKLQAALKSGKPVFMKLYASWCGACQGMQDEWNHLLKKDSALFDMAYPLAVEEDAIKVLKSTSPSMFELTGYPTLFMVGLDGKRGPDMNTGRTAAMMTEFVKEFVQSNKKGGASNKKSKKSKRSTKKSKRSTKKSKRSTRRKPVLRHRKKRRSVRYGLNPIVTQQ